MATQIDIIDKVFPETLKILSDLIKFQTVSGTSNLALIEYCEKRLSKAGASSFRTSDDVKKRFNLFSTVNGKIQQFNTVYNYIDVLRITNIDIKVKTWTAEFYLDLVSQSDDPLNQVIFNNLSYQKYLFNILYLLSV